MKIGQIRNSVRRQRAGLALLLVLFASGLSGAQGWVAKVGLVILHSPELASHVDGIRQELQSRGYVDGSAIKIDAHFTNVDKRLREILNAFVASRVDVIVAWTNSTVQLAKKATQGIPIVMIASGPVAAGLIDSLKQKDAGDKIEE